MRDILPPESARWRRFTAVFAEVVEAAGYGQIIPPLLEDIGVFSRIGEATDVVTKEMYDFVDKGDRHVALRPERTASVCRAFVEHHPLTPWKTWYSGPNFRYEKPQRGRYRQFDQVGIEVLGADDPYLDVEVIALGWRVLPSASGCAGSTLRRQQPRRARRPGPLRRRPPRPLRAVGDLDVREPRDAGPQPAARPRLQARARRRRRSPPRPASPTSTRDATAEHFAIVQAGLTSLGIPFAVEPRLVRGLDYYRRTIFEYQGGTLDSAQNALGGGGRYDGLVEDLGGPSTPGIGFALGVDRTLLACDDEGVFDPPATAVAVFVVDTTGGEQALLITDELRARRRSRPTGPTRVAA